MQTGLGDGKVNGVRFRRWEQKLWLVTCHGRHDSSASCINARHCAILIRNLWALVDHVRSSIVFRAPRVCLSLQLAVVLDSTYVQSCYSQTGIAYRFAIVGGVSKEKKFFCAVRFARFYPKLWSHGSGMWFTGLLRIHGIFCGPSPLSVMLRFLAGWYARA